MELQIECLYNKKTSHISYEHFQTCDYLTSLPPKQAKLIFKAKTGCLTSRLTSKTSMLREQSLSLTGTGAEGNQQGYEIF